MVVLAKAIILLLKAEAELSISQASRLDDLSLNRCCELTILSVQPRGILINSISNEREAVLDIVKRDAAGGKSYHSNKLVAGDIDLDNLIVLECLVLTLLDVEARCCRATLCTS